LHDHFGQTLEHDDSVVQFFDHHHSNIIYQPVAIVKHLLYLRSYPFLFDPVASSVIQQLGPVVWTVVRTVTALARADPAPFDLLAVRAAIVSVGSFLPFLFR
jgi:hypothetical protein